MFELHDFRRQKLPNTSKTRKYRRMLFQGVLVALPMLVNEITDIIISKFNIPWRNWIIMINWNWYISTSPFAYLVFNSKLRGDIFRKENHSLKFLLGQQVAQAIALNAAILPPKEHFATPAKNQIQPQPVDKNLNFTTHA